MASTKRKTLTLEERVKVVKAHEAGESARKISERITCGKTQIQTVIRNKAAIMQEWEKGGSSKRKYLTARRTLYGNLNDHVWQWFCTAHSKNIPMTGRLIQEKATMLAVAMGHVEFTASNGWLDSFKKRHDIKASVLSGEAADVSEDVVANWSQRIDTICAGYEPKDIFNADETGVFFRTLPDRSLVVKGDSCKGGKRAKDRITALIACSAAGEKLPLLVIGKSAKPRAFKRYPMESVGVTYRHNRKAWMTTDLFTEWLKSVNNKMGAQHRKILLLVDNCSAHPDITLEHVKLTFLPPNTTSRLQPCDAGIIQNLKQLYRKKMMRHIICHMDDCRTASDLAKKIDVLDAILWLRSSWDAVKPSTIVKCFGNCGITVDAIQPDVANVAEDVAEFAVLLGDVTIDQFTGCDDFVDTTNCAGVDWEADIVEAARRVATGAATAADSDAGDDSDDEEDQAPQEPPAVPLTCQQAAAHLRALRDFGLLTNQPQFTVLICQAEELLEANQCKKANSMKQSTIDTFF